MSQRCCRGAPKITPKVFQTTAKTDPRGPQKEVKNSLQVKEQNNWAQESEPRRPPKATKNRKKGFTYRTRSREPSRTPKDHKKLPKWRQNGRKSLQNRLQFLTFFPCYLLASCLVCVCVFALSPARHGGGFCEARGYYTMLYYLILSDLISSYII